MAARIKTLREIKTDLGIGASLPSCPSNITPFI
jgi:hypothetical protein